VYLYDSSLAVRKNGLSDVTYYSNYFTRREWVFALGVVGVGMVIFVIIAIGVFGQP
jgi:hypothetical protein